MPAGNDSGPAEHRVTECRQREVVGGFDIVVHCSCGAAWSHQANVSEEEMDSIFRSHVRYFDRKTEVQ